MSSNVIRVGDYIKCKDCFTIVDTSKAVGKYKMSADNMVCGTCSGFNLEWKNDSVKEGE